MVETPVEQLGRVLEITQAIRLHPWPQEQVFRVDFFACTGVMYIQHCYRRVDAVTGVVGWGHGRKWHVSPHATESEIVLTCLKAAITDSEHEVREGFYYQGHPIFQPHQDVKALVDACQHSDARSDPNL